MLRRLIAGVRRWTDRDEDSGFVGSRLDASVRYAHGQGDTEATRELKRLEAAADDLEDDQP
jgi:hypothetical protein